MKQAAIALALVVAGASALALFDVPIAWPVREASRPDVGMIESREVEVASLITARILELGADEGVRVRRGDTLAVLEKDEIALGASELEAKLAEARAALAAIESLPRAEDIAVQRSRIAEAEVVLERARCDLDRARRLGAWSVSDREMADLEAEVRLVTQRLATARSEMARLEAGALPAEVQAATARVVQLSRALDRARLELTRTVILSPIDGVVRSRHYEVGELVRAGDPLFTCMISGISIGAIIATRSPTQEVAWQYLGLYVLIGATVFSGWIYPLSSMPDAARAISAALPPRWYLEIVRAVLLKGASASELQRQFAFLAGLTLACATVALLAVLSLRALLRAEDAGG
jgi:multidrug efflux pump subunit AcrA (membrane-fusion protein)